MANGDLAARIASGELRSLADRMFTQAEARADKGVCVHHAEQCRAIGCLLLGMDELINQRRSLRSLILSTAPLWIPISAVSGGAAFGIAFAIARLSGIAP